MARFDPLRILDVLAEHEVRHVVIGGMAAAARGSPSITQDIAICYDRSPDNLERLARALRALHAHLRGAPEDIPFLLDAKTLANGDHFTFATDVGDFDCLGTPAGTAGYNDLASAATPLEFDGLQVLVTSLDDLIRMKRAAGRPKDRIELEVLGALREEIERDLPS
ncbi:MAG: hypothetical protein HY775_02855 [Acidobacteria bacterium]|nr:hypothetical protein [Acidobacteriota bacterium]